MSHTVCCHRAPDKMTHYWKTGDVMDLSRALWAYNCLASPPPPHPSEAPPAWPSQCRQATMLDTSHTNSEHIEVEYWKSEKSCRIFRDPQESDTFFRCATFTSNQIGLLSELTCLVQVLKQWSSLRPTRKLPRQFACHFGAHKSGILQIWKIAWSLRISVFRSGIFQDSATFQIAHSTSQCSELARKVAGPVSSRHLNIEFSQRPVGKCRDTLHANSEHLEVEYCKY
jgi:hypothetical protein